MSKFFRIANIIFSTFRLLKLVQAESLCNFEMNKSLVVQSKNYRGEELLVVSTKSIYCTTITLFNKDVVPFPMW